MDILLVDESRTMSMIVQRAIRQAGYRGPTVGEAKNGAQALEKLNAEQPRLILSDWKMPEMSGFELLKSVRAGHHNVLYGFIPSPTSAGIRKLAMHAGANSLITRPFTPEDVQETLYPILGGS